MPCLRFDLHRLFPLYLDGAAPSRTTARIERHLLDCSACRARLVRMRDAKSLLGELPPLAAPAFERVMARAPRGERRFSFAVPSVLRHLAADALIATVLFAIFTLFYTHAASARNRQFDFSSFRALAVGQIAATDDPHVIVQGVVSQTSGDTDEGSHRFRLTDPHNPNAFVVCEILDGDPMTPPKPGSRVRVWGVSRYDPSPDHRWFEIHPVLRVEVLP
ncbi:MAG: zf-HC2 domain-containing protein [Acidobacteria bacterium]|nr:zf-HC2 domain-containing protein [Acidobacteriota bacterium]MBV9071347.1 zf-HC2 domain-containing protein [Acidobacteriota bacterium]MBV9476465.1 zf-HC2 domain-containing protein [Acidobacteriota bacterium]